MVDINNVMIIIFLIISKYHIYILLFSIFSNNMLSRRFYIIKIDIFIILLIYIMLDIYYKNNDIIWEDKAIILGLIYYINLNIFEFKNIPIIIENKLYRKIIEKLFTSIIFLNKGDGSNINIKSYCNENICINNLKNFQKNIQCNNLFILPWSFSDNPLILIEKGNKLSYDINFILGKILIMKNSLQVKYYKFNNIDDIDNSYYIDNKKLEKYILKKFVNTNYTNKSWKQIRNYINKKLLPIENKKEKVYVPYIQKIPIFINKYLNNIAPQVIEKEKIVQTYDPELIKLINNNIKTLNNYLDFEK